MKLLDGQGLIPAWPTQAPNGVEPLRLRHSPSGSHDAPECVSFHAAVEPLQRPKALEIGAGIRDCTELSPAACLAALTPGMGCGFVTLTPAEIVKRPTALLKPSPRKWRIVSYVLIKARW